MGSVRNFVRGIAHDALYQHINTKARINWVTGRLPLNNFTQEKPLGKQDKEDFEKKFLIRAGPRLLSGWGDEQLSAMVPKVTQPVDTTLSQNS